VKKEAHNYNFTSGQAQDLEAFESLQLLFPYYTQAIGKLCHDLPMYLSSVCASLCSMLARRSAPPVLVAYRTHYKIEMLWCGGVGVDVS